MDRVILISASRLTEARMGGPSGDRLMLRVGPQSRRQDEHGNRVPTRRHRVRSLERGLLSLLAGGESDPFPVSVRDQSLIFQLEQDRTGNPDEEGKLLHKARTSRSLRLIGLAAGVIRRLDAWHCGSGRW